MQLKNRDAFVFKYLWLPSKGRRLRALPGLPLQDQRCWSQQLGQASAPRCWTFPHLIPPLGYTNEWICCSLHPNCGLLGCILLLVKISQRLYFQEKFLKRSVCAVLFVLPNTGWADSSMSPCIGSRDVSREEMVRKWWVWGAVCWDTPSPSWTAYLPLSYWLMFFIWHGKLSN